MAKPNLTQSQREGLAELLGAISDAPHGDLLAGRAFETLRGPMYQLLMDIVDGDKVEITASVEQLQQARADVRTIGVGS